MASRYDVFLCHNQADKPAVQELADRLCAEGLEPWLDKSDLRRGVPWTEEVEKCLVEESASCAVIIGPSGLGPWQEQELRVAQNRQVEAKRKNGSFPVIPVLLPGGKLETLPPFLKGHTCVFFPKSLDDKDAFDEFLRAIRGLPPLRSRPTSDDCPYRGLEFFDVAHAPYFYGREELTTRLLDRLRSNSQNRAPSRFLAIVGASGSGKSSLARAGLVAALKQGAVEGSDQWPVVICRPGSDPIANLAIELARKAGLELDKQTAFMDRCKDRLPQDRAALHESVQLILPPNDPNRRLVLLVDQFEELFTTCRDEKLRTAFVDNLVYASHVPQGQTLVLLAMRADFYGKCATYSNLANALSERQQLIGPMTREELQQAIEKPAQKVSCEMEPGLVDLLLNDVVNDPGSLPFLQFALRDLWNRRTGRKLTTEAYRAIGGVTGALQRKADEVYSQLSEPQQRICRRIFLRLTQPGEGTEDTKRRVPVSELQPLSGSLAEVQSVLLDLSEAETRLITGEAADGQEFVEVAHEALIRGWPQLRSWIDTDRAALLTQRRLTEAANQWKDHDRDASFLYTGPRLAAAQEWASLHPAEINRLESEFIKASLRYARRQRLQVAGIAAVVLLAVTAGWLGLRAQSIEQNNRTRAEGLVDQLKKAEIGEVPAIVQRLERYRKWADSLLGQEDAQSVPGSSQKLHIDLALLGVDGTKVGELRDELLRVSPAEFVVVRDFLPRAVEPGDLAPSVTEPLWNRALDSQRPAQQRFQAACAVATYSPSDPRWRGINAFVAERLLSFEASALVPWREALRPARAELVEPLVKIYRDATRKEQTRTYAAETLADYATDQPAQLFELLADAELFQFPAVLERLVLHSNEMGALATAELGRQPPENATETQKESLAKRKVNAAVALLRVRNAAPIWPLLKSGPDPRVRSYLIHALCPLGTNPQLIAERLDMEPDLTIRRALVLVLGQFTTAQLAPTARGPLVEKLLAIFENEPDAGLHGVAEWVLRKWQHGKRLEKVVEKLKSDEKRLQARQSSDPRRWYVNSQQETFAIVDARDGVFLMGSPESEPRRFTNEGQHRVHLGRRFAISTKEITREQYERFQKDRPEITRVDTRGWAKTGDCPQTVVNWYDAVSYCNWLSEREGIPKDEWCYEPNKEGKFAAGMKPKDRFWELAGYRLPTEAEWEYACRAGTITPRYYGLDEKLLPYYAWDLEDSDSRAFPTGILEPNDWGLFDMAGNAYEWCFDQYADYPKETDQVFEDRPSTRPVEIGKVRVMRGGSFTTRSQVIRSADRDDYAPEQGYSFFGFRPVRTYP